MCWTQEFECMDEDDEMTTTKQAINHQFMSKAKTKKEATIINHDREEDICMYVCMYACDDGLFPPILYVAMIAL